MLLERKPDLHLVRPRRHEMRAAECGQDVVERFRVQEIDDAEHQSCEPRRASDCGLSGSRRPTPRRGATSPRSAVSDEPDTEGLLRQALLAEVKPRGFVAR